MGGKLEEVQGPSLRVKLDAEVLILDNKCVIIKLLRQH